MNENNAILLVEDNPDDVELALRAFRKNKICNRVAVARDGAEALDYLFGTGEFQNKPQNPLPQVVLLDLKLPKVDGLEVLKRIRENERTKLLPVVILTSSQEEQDMMDGYLRGANSYIRKPIDFTQFADAVAQMHLYWMVLNQAPPTPESGK